MKTILLITLFEMMCKPGFLIGKKEKVILSSTYKQEEIVYFEVDLKENLYQYISVDGKDTTTLVIENGNLYEVGDKNKIRIIK